MDRRGLVLKKHGDSILLSYTRLAGAGTRTQVSTVFVRTEITSLTADASAGMTVEQRASRVKRSGSPTGRPASPLPPKGPRSACRRSGTRLSEVIDGRLTRASVLVRSVFSRASALVLRRVLRPAAAARSPPSRKPVGYRTITAAPGTARTLTCRLLGHLLKRTATGSRHTPSFTRGSGHPRTCAPGWGSLPRPRNECQVGDP